MTQAMKMEYDAIDRLNLLIENKESYSFKSYEFVYSLDVLDDWVIVSRGGMRVNIHNPRARYDEDLDKIIIYSRTDVGSWVALNPEILPRMV